MDLIPFSQRDLISRFHPSQLHDTVPQADRSESVQPSHTGIAFGGERTPPCLAGSIGFFQRPRFLLDTKPMPVVVSNAPITPVILPELPAMDTVLVVYENPWLQTGCDHHLQRYLGGLRTGASLYRHVGKPPKPFWSI